MLKTALDNLHKASTKKFTEHSAFPKFVGIIKTCQISVACGYKDLLDIHVICSQMISVTLLYLLSSLKEQSLSGRCHPHGRTEKAKIEPYDGFLLCNICHF